jgi:hypothetical protein
MLEGVARRWNFKNVEELVAKEFGGVVFHFGLNYMGGHTIEHCDEYTADGPGHWILNLALQGDGLLFFSEDGQGSKRQQTNVHAVWQVRDARTHIHTHIHIHTHTHTCTHIHTHTHTNTHRRSVIALLSVTSVVQRCSTEY